MMAGGLQKRLHNEPEHSFAVLGHSWREVVPEKQGGVRLRNHPELVVQRMQTVQMALALILEGWLLEAGYL
jgi:hypothetical protein